MDDKTLAWMNERVRKGNALVDDIKKRLANVEFLRNFTCQPFQLEIKTSGSYYRMSIDGRMAGEVISAIQSVCQKEADRLQAEFASL